MTPFLPIDPAAVTDPQQRLPAVALDVRRQLADAEAHLQEADAHLVAVAALPPHPNTAATVRHHHPAAPTCAPSGWPCCAASWPSWRPPAPPAEPSSNDLNRVHVTEGDAPPGHHRRS